jgi:hypothetical protein
MRVGLKKIAPEGAMKNRGIFNEQKCSRGNEF